MAPTKTDFENVVCDLHLADMRSVQLHRGTEVIEGFGKCPVGGCTRFFGREGYCELTDKGGFARVRTEPTCSTGHEPQAMYLQRTPGRLQWVCPVCRSVTASRRGL